MVEFTGPADLHTSIEGITEQKNPIQKSLSTYFYNNFQKVIRKSRHSKLVDSVALSSDHITTDDVLTDPSINVDSVQPGFQLTSEASVQNCQFYAGHTEQTFDGEKSCSADDSLYTTETYSQELVENVSSHVDIGLKKDINYLSDSQNSSVLSISNKNVISYITASTDSSSISTQCPSNNTSHVVTVYQNTCNVEVPLKAVSSIETTETCCVPDDELRPVELEEHLIPISDEMSSVSGRDEMFSISHDQLCTD